MTVTHWEAVENPKMLKHKRLASAMADTIAREIQGHWKYPLLAIDIGYNDDTITFSLVFGHILSETRRMGAGFMVEDTWLETAGGVSELVHMTVMEFVDKLKNQLESGPNEITMN